MVNLLTSPIAIVLEVAIAFFVLGFIETVFKPVSMEFWRTQVIPNLGGWLQVADPLMPERLKDLNGQELQDVLINDLVKLTGDSTFRAIPKKKMLALELFAREHSVFVNADKIED